MLPTAGGCKGLKGLSSVCEKHRQERGWGSRRDALEAQRPVQSDLGKRAVCQPGCSSSKGEPLGGYPGGARREDRAVEATRWVCGAGFRPGCWGRREAQDADRNTMLAGVGTGRPVSQVCTCMHECRGKENFSATASRETKESYQTTTREGKTFFPLCKKVPVPAPLLPLGEKESWLLREEEEPQHARPGPCWAHVLHKAPMGSTGQKAG